MDFVHPLAVDKIDGSEVIVNEGELRAVLGDGWEDTGYPESVADPGFEVRVCLEKKTNVISIVKYTIR